MAQVLKRPTEEEMNKVLEKEKLFENLEKEIKSEEVLCVLKDCITDLEWVKIWTNELDKENKLDEVKKNRKYKRLYEKMLSEVKKVSNLIQVKETIYLNFPPTKGATWERIEKELSDAYEEAKELILKAYPYQRYRKNSRERQEDSLTKTFARAKLHNLKSKDLEDDNLLEELIKDAYGDKKIKSRMKKIKAHYEKNQK